MKHRILLVDDHQIFREALRGLLNQEATLEVVADVGDAADLIRLVRDLAVDIVCMDIGLPGPSGIAATQQLLAACPTVKVVALSTHHDPTSVCDMIRLYALSCGS
jgi:two-component system response regulator DegU